MFTAEFWYLLKHGFLVDVSWQAANFWLVHFIGISLQSSSGLGFAYLRDFLSSADRAVGNKSLWVWSKAQ